MHPVSNYQPKNHGQAKIGMRVNVYQNSLTSSLPLSIFGSVPNWFVVTNLCLQYRSNFEFITFTSETLLKI